MTLSMVFIRFSNRFENEDAHRHGSTHVMPR